MYLCDSHIHSEFSFDAEIPVEEMVKCGIEKNLKVMTITDHCDVAAIGEPDNEFGVVLEKAIPASVKETRRVAQLYSGKIKVMTGVELGEPTHFPNKTKTALAMADYDLILASTHEVRSREDFYFLEYTAENIPVLLKEYYLEQLEVVRWNGFDSLAHFDYPLRYIAERTDIKPDFTQFDGIIDEILKTLAQNQKALEVNTSTLKKPLGRTMPGVDILKRFKAFGGRYITLGSDAHTKEALVQNFNEAVDMIKSAGFDSYCYFEKHTPVELRLN